MMGIQIVLLDQIYLKVIYQIVSVDFLKIFVKDY